MGVSEVSLYKICLKRVYSLLKAGTWKSCSINPFSYLPSGIIDDFLPYIHYDYATISDIFLLLASGSLTRLHLSGFKLQEEQDLLLEVIRRNGFKSLRFLAWHFGEKRSIPLVEALVRSSPKLEEFHSSYFFNFDVFQNCKELRVLMFSTSVPVPLHEDLSVNLPVLSSLKNLQVLCIFNSCGDTIATILKYYPRLLSLGRCDSLDGLEKIHANAVRKCKIDCTDMPYHFRLQRCLWGRRIETFTLMTSDMILLYKASFPEKIRKAVSLCPFVGELIIYVNHINSIESLKNLKHLFYLIISFRECDGDYMEDFLKLLKIIGRKLKHLSIDGRQPVPVDIICGYCPQLQCLELKRSATVSGPVQHHRNVFLKKLRIMKIDQKALLFLLSSCKALVELSVCDALCLDDSLLSQILELNPLKNLKISDITESNLTSRGFRMILETAKSLERVHFAPFRREVAYEVEKLIRELKLTNVTYGEIYDIPCNEFGCSTPMYRY